jgi:hypothetical protein
MVLESSTDSITAGGALTLRAGSGIVLKDHLYSLSYRKPLVIDSDLLNAGVGTLTVASGKNVQSRDGALQVTAWDIDLQELWVGPDYYGARLDAGRSTVDIHASKEDQSIGLGAAHGQNMHVTDSELIRIVALQAVTFTRFGGGSIVVNSVSRKYSTKADSIVFGDPFGDVVTSAYKQAQIPQVKVQSYTTAADFESANTGTPRMEAATMVSMGSDIVVRWHPDIYSGRLSHRHDWIGLYPKGACADDDTTTHNRIHKCYVAWQYMQEGLSYGETRFTLQQYKVAGEYEVRYFYGDSPDGQGYYCITLGGTGSTYKQCVLRTQAIAGPIYVKQISALTNVPGLVEKYCDGSKKICQ